MEIRVDKDKTAIRIQPVAQAEGCRTGPCQHTHIREDAVKENTSLSRRERKAGQDYEGPLVSMEVIMVRHQESHACLTVYAEGQSSVTAVLLPAELDSLPTRAATGQFSEAKTLNAVHIGTL